MRRHSFTFIEALVVFAIIGILFSIMSASYRNSQIRSRDATRKRDAQSIKLAVTSYYQINHCYPAAGDNVLFNPQDTLPCSKHPTSSSMYAACRNYSVYWDMFATNLQPYLNSLPNDPRSKCSLSTLPHVADGGLGHVYFYAGQNNTPANGGSKYVVIVALENVNDPDRNMPITTPNSQKTDNAIPKIGKYARLFHYDSLASFANADLRPIYGAGCFLTDANNPNTSACINNQ